MSLSQLQWGLPGLQGRPCSRAGGQQLEPHPRHVRLGPHSRCDHWQVQKEGPGDEISLLPSLLP